MMRGVVVVVLVAVVVSLSGRGHAQPASGSAGPASSVVHAPSRHPEEGRPFIRNYRPLEVGGGGQNWAMVQDSRGVIYVASQLGVLEFDGASWRLIEQPTAGTVRSLAIDQAGRIYVGSVGEIGFLAPDGTGDLRWNSLTSHVPAESRPFPDVWRTFATANGVLFQTEREIFRWVNGTLSVLRASTRFNRGSMVDGQLYLTIPETGLNVLEGNAFRALPGTESLGREVYPVILRYDERRLLIGTRLNGLFLYDGATLTPFVTEADDWLKRASVYRGLTLPDGTIAFASTAGGVGIIDRQGRQLAIIDQERGLPSNSIYYLMRDREGALWTAGERGINRIEIPSPATFFGPGDGFNGYFSMQRHLGRLYLAGQSGLTYLRSPTPDDPRRIAPIPGPRNQCWCVREHARCLRAAASCAAGCVHGRLVRGHRHDVGPDSRARRWHLPLGGAVTVESRPDTTVDWAVRRPCLVSLGRRTVDRRRPGGRDRRSDSDAPREPRRVALGGDSGNRDPARAVSPLRPVRAWHGRRRPPSGSARSTGCPMAESARWRCTASCTLRPGAPAATGSWRGSIQRLAGSCMTRPSTCCHSIASEAGSGSPRVPRARCSPTLVAAEPY